MMSWLFINRLSATVVPPVTLFSQQCYFELGPKKFELLKLFFSNLRYFSLQLHYFLLFPPSYATSYVLEEKSSVTDRKNTKIVQDIYYLNKPRVMLFRSYAILK